MTHIQTRQGGRFFTFLFATVLSLGLLFAPLLPFGQTVPVAHAQLTCAEPHILVSNGEVGLNGNLVQGFNTSFGFENSVNVGDLDDPHDITIGPDGNLYIADTQNNRIQRYNFTADTVETVATVPFPFGITFGPDNNLYITGGGGIGGGIQVLRVTGLFDSPSPTLPITATVFVPQTDTDNNYTLNRLTEGIEFGPDGFLYVGSNNSAFDGSGTGHHGVLRFDTAGNFASIVTTHAGTGFNDLRDIGFGPDGNLYTTEYSDNRLRYYSVSAAGIGTLEGTVFPLTRPVGFAFSPEGDLFVTEYNASGGVGQVNRLTFSGGTWSIVGSFGEPQLDQTKAIVFTQCLDWGDLPNTYGTLFSSNGPRHIIDDTLRLGVCVDGETDGQPSDMADGDDSSELATIIFGTCIDDDEDGVYFPRPTDGDGSRGNWSDGDGHINVTVTGGDACLNVWVDFGDGTSLGPNGQFDVVAGPMNEHVIINAVVSTGVTEFDFTLPVGAADAATLAVRARLTPRDADTTCASAEAYQSGTASPQGLATGGEVEDYMVAFSPTAVSLSQNPTALPAASTTLPIIAFLLTGFTLLLLWRRPQVRTR